MKSKAQQLRRVIWDMSARASVNLQGWEGGLEGPSPLEFSCGLSVRQRHRSLQAKILKGNGPKRGKHVVPARPFTFAPWRLNLHSRELIHRNTCMLPLETYTLTTLSEGGKYKNTLTYVKITSDNWE